MKTTLIYSLSVFATVWALLMPAQSNAAEEGKYKYDDFQKPKSCKGCHSEIYQEWKQSLMSQSFTHEWDQIEYFKLALPHAEKLEKVSGVKAGCIACHSPLAFLSGDIPPKPADQNSRANEGVSCEVCHHITGSSEKVPFNFSFNIEPGDTMNGPRADAESPVHDTHNLPFLQSAEHCATCHDEQSPYGAWVKSTYREWKASPYAKENTTCQDCHMYDAPGKSAGAGKKRDDIAHHVFHGSHSMGKMAGAVDIAMYSKKKALKKEEPVTCRPADLLPPEMEKLTAELGDKAKSVEDVLSYALFPDVALQFFAEREAGEFKPEDKLPKD